ncbi:MAG TPA: hypothetical protein VK726_07185 [Acetobacteraceae bacterium]|jgi:hypothetical protein|nr:hypothetical protein [Acetobacteraceae bacterium]
MAEGQLHAIAPLFFVADVADGADIVDPVVDRDYYGNHEFAVRDLDG